jgi:two-component system phosphate regulon response regulator OmpR
MKTINVLFVDDEKIIQQFALPRLSLLGMKVQGAMNTAEADAILSRDKMDIIILDVLMAGEDGLSYCRRIREEGNRVPVILLSSFNNLDAVSLGMAAGAEAYMCKPFDIEELYQRILQLLHASTSKK